MNKETWDLERLAAQARAGDAWAAEELRRELAAGLPRIVRRTLHAGPRPTPLARHVQSAALRLVRDDPDQGSRATEAGVAEELCTAVIGRLHQVGAGAAAPAETVRGF